MIFSGTPVRPHFKATSANAVWSPTTKKRSNLHLNLNSADAQNNNAPVQNSFEQEDEASPVWQPFGAPYDIRGFRPVKLEVNRNMTAPTIQQTETPHRPEPPEFKPDSPELMLNDRISSEQSAAESGADHQPSVPSAIDASANSSTVFTKTGWSGHLPASQSPTITLLQKAREGQLPKGAVYIEEKSESTPIPKNAVLFDQKVIVDGDKIHTDSYYAVPTLTTETTTHNVNAPPKYDGIGPTEYGIPVGLRTGVKEEYASDWYKTMYKSLHKAKFPHDTPSQTVHVGGYVSEPEYERRDKRLLKYSTDHRRKPEKPAAVALSPPHSAPIRKSPEPAVIRREQKSETYKVEPRSIAEYEPGRSSLAEKEFNKFWSDFWDSMDDLHQHIGYSPYNPPSTQGLKRRWPNVLLTDGYESDSTLIRKTGKSLDVDPELQKSWYKEIQKGGEIPLTGLRKTVPEKPVSPHQYQETQVNIHFKSPIRNLEKEFIDDEELIKRQEEAMQRLYEEERRKKHQQELAEMEMRRHSDFFTPSQKSPIALDRYDNPFEVAHHRLAPPGFSRGPPMKTMARALFPFMGQTTRELSLGKGDIVYINKKVDNNWYEGEHHGLVGIFPVPYVEIIPNEKANLQPRKSTEGDAIVKYNFRSQTPQELSLFKGERVVLTRRIDPNWYEGRFGVKKGIFPASYVNVFHEPGEHISIVQATSPITPTSHVFPTVNGSHTKVDAPSYTSVFRSARSRPLLSKSSSITQTLHIDTYNEPIPYRSLYSYKPQNDDELELREGDTVYVMEKCDDGWYVGTSLRTGLFGTFPGNYVERI